MVHLALAALIWSTATFAQTPIHDPKNLLSEVRTVAGQVPFDNAFHCGDTALLNVIYFGCERHECDSSQCLSICKSVEAPGIPVTRQVVNCAADSVGILLDNGDLSEVHRTSFESAHRSPVELFLGDLATFIHYPNSEVTLETLTPSRYILGRGTTKERSVTAMNLSGRIGQSGIRQLSFLLTVIQNSPAVAQVVRFRLNESTWFLVKEFEQATTNSSRVCK